MGKEKKPSFGVIFWVALLCFVVVLYLGSRMRFPQWIAERFGGDYRAVSSQRELPKDPKPTQPSAPESGTPAPAQPAPIQPAPGVPSQGEEHPVPPVPEDTASPGSGSPTQPEPGSGNTSSQTVAKTLPPKQRSRVSKLYFVKVSDRGSPHLVPVERTITFESAPLAETLKELLKGPSAGERKEGIASLIPPGTALKSVILREGIAYVNLNESFRFNPMGREGYQGQVQQIVFTVTEFPGIQGVQFLLEGKTLEYLSPEGVYIGKPLRRDSFASQ